MTNACNNGPNTIKDHANFILYCVLYTLSRIQTGKFLAPENLPV